MNDYRSKRRHRQEERDYTKSSISRAILAHCNTPEGRAEMAEWREKAAKKTEAPKPKVDPALEYYQMAFKPGSLMVTSGRRGGGKTHAAISFGQMLVSGKYPELGRWRIATNVIFLRKEGNRFVTDYPKGVHHIISMKELFPIAADVLEKGENLLLILDEAQNFLLGEHNGTATVTSMKTFMGIIRKFNIAVWLLSPVVKNMGPAFRYFIDDEEVAGNVNIMWMKDEKQAKAVINRLHSKRDPRDAIFMQYSAKEDPVGMWIPRLSWTTPPEELKEGEFCYDHKASAEFSVGDGFDFKAFISATGNVSSFEMVDAIRNFYKDMKEVGKEESKSSEETLLSAASRIKSMGLTDESISRAFGIPVTTLRRKAEEYGLSWAVDRSETNIDRYKKVKNAAE